MKKIKLLHFSANCKENSIQDSDGVKYWIETTEENGAIFCIQKSKKTTRSAPSLISILAEYEDGSFGIISINSLTNEKNIREFLNTIGGIYVLNEIQVKLLRKIYKTEDSVESKGKKSMSISVRFLKDNVNFTGKLLKCLILTDNINIGYKPVLIALNTDYNLKNLNEVFKNKGEIEIKHENGSSIKKIFSRDVLNKLFIQENIQIKDISITTQKVLSTLSLKKGDNVKTKKGEFGEIVKYSSNKEITLYNSETGERWIVTKEDILELANK